MGLLGVERKSLIHPPLLEAHIQVTKQLYQNVIANVDMDECQRQSIDATSPPPQQFSLCTLCDALICSEDEQSAP